MLELIHIEKLNEWLIHDKVLLDIFKKKGNFFRRGSIKAYYDPILACSYCIDLTICIIKW